MKIKHTNGIQFKFGSLDQNKQCIANAVNPKAAKIDDPTYNVCKIKQKILIKKNKDEEINHLSIESFDKIQEDQICDERCNGNEN